MTTSGISIEGAPFTLVQGRGFDYDAYHRQVLSPDRGAFLSPAGLVAATRLHAPLPSVIFRGRSEPLAQTAQAASVGEERLRLCRRAVGHGWHDSALVVQVLLAALAFSLAASAVYVGNGLADREQDRQHPDKCRRPLASGSHRRCAGTAAGGGAWSPPAFSAGSPPAVLGILLAYLLLNVGYARPQAWCCSMSSSFPPASCCAFLPVPGVGIHPSNWLLLCGLMVTLFLGFAKRRAG